MNDIRTEANGITRYSCLYNRDWFNEGYTCEFWIQRMKMSDGARVASADSHRQEVENKKLSELNNLTAERRHQETLLSNWKIALVSFVLGVLGTLLFQYLL